MFLKVPPNLQENTCTRVSRAKTFQNTYFVDHDILYCWFTYWKLNISEHVFGKIKENKTIRKSYYWLIPQKKDCKTLFLKFFYPLNSWNVKLKLRYTFSFSGNSYFWKSTYFLISFIWYMILEHFPPIFFYCVENQVTSSPFQKWNSRFNMC